MHQVIEHSRIELNMLLSVLDNNKKQQDTHDPTIVDELESYNIKKLKETSPLK